MSMTKRILMIVFVLVACVGCDQATKSLAEAYLTETEVQSFLGDTLRLQLAHNTGAFLSLGANLPEAWREGIFSTGTAALLLVLLAFTLFFKSATTLEIVAYSLFLAGGAGNLIDRVMCGYVVDFMNVGIGPLRTGIFNVADIAVTFAVFVLVAESLRKRKGL